MKLQAVVLAAGKGTRMKSATPKVMHPLAGRPMLAHVLDAVREAGATDVLVVTGPELRADVEAMGARAVIQEPRNGTGHAMQLAMDVVGDAAGDVLVVSADMPLLSPALLRAIAEKRAASSSPLAMVTARVRLPSDFGRVVRENGRVARIVEHADASPRELAIDEVNAAVYCFDASALRESLSRLQPNNAQGELYLTDCVGAIAAAGGVIETLECGDGVEAAGVNNRVELATAGGIMRRRILERHMLAGVTIVDPAATYVDAGVTIGADTVIEPNSHLRGTTKVGRSCTLGPNVVLENATIGDGARIAYSVVRDSEVGASVNVGPFAHLRNGAVIEENARVGNFVEVKKSRLGRGVKASHLSYLGDAEIGDEANIGAGTITCNFDGIRKNKTKIGRRASIGSNTALVAPVELGDGALTGAGSVVTRDVAPGQRVAGNPARPLPEKPSSGTP